MEAFLCGFLCHLEGAGSAGPGLPAVLGTRTGPGASALELKGLIPSGDTNAPFLHRNACLKKLLVIRIGLVFPAAFRLLGQGGLSWLGKASPPPKELCVPSGPTEGARPPAVGISCVSLGPAMDAGPHSSFHTLR